MESGGPGDPLPKGAVCALPASRALQAPGPWWLPRSLAGSLPLAQNLLSRRDSPGHPEHDRCHFLVPLIARPFPAPDPAPSDKIPSSQEAGPREHGRDHFLPHQQRLRLQLFRKSNSQTREKPGLTKPPAEAAEAGPTAVLSAVDSHHWGWAREPCYKGQEPTRGPRHRPALTHPVKRLSAPTARHRIRHSFSQPRYWIPTNLL